METGFFVSRAVLKRSAHQIGIVNVNVVGKAVPKAV